MRADVVAEPLADRLDQALELRVLERRELPAAVADRVVMVLAGRIGRLVTRCPVDVESPDELEPRQHVKRAIDAREADATVAAA